ncbi:MAG: SWIM zinc finger family protein [Bacteroidota bacterium]
MPLPPISVADVQARVDGGSFSRGRAYADRGYVHDLRRQGRTLKAACTGSAPTPYALRVTFDAHGIAEADCSCPIGHGGYCKHIVALLLTWIDRPDRFAEVASVETGLAARSKEELIALIQTMIGRYPELEDLVAMSTSPQAPPAIGAIRRRLRRVLAGGEHEWGHSRQTAQALQDVLAVAAPYAEAAQWPQVQAICEAWLDEVLGVYGELYDHDGDIAMVIDEVVAYLGQCLQHGTDPALHRQAIHLLYDVQQTDIAMGGLDLGYEAPELIADHATPSERNELIVRLEDALRRTHSSWKREALGHLLLTLQPGPVDHDTYLQICRVSGQTEALVGRLLHLGRLEEAVEAAREVSDDELMRLAPLFMEQGYDEAMDALALSRLGTYTSYRLMAWIKDRAKARADGALAERLVRHLFEMAPSLERYQEAVELSQARGNEADTRTALRGVLRERKHLSVLVRALLHDGEPDEALKLMYQPRSEWGGSASRRDALRPTVAAALADTHPEEAQQLYLDAATDHIERRSRSHYAEAAQLLVHVRAIYRGRGRAEEWDLLISEFRTAFKRLRAFREELDKAGL